MPNIFPLIAPLLGQIALWGSSIGLSTAAITGVLTAVSYGIQTALVVGASVIANLLFAPKQPKPGDNQVLRREPTHPRLRSYGEVMVGGVLAALFVKDGSLHRVIATGSGRIHSRRKTFIDSTEVTVVAGIVTTDPWGQSGGFVRIQTRDGLDTETAYAGLVAAIPQWTSAHRGDGVPSVWIQCLRARGDDIAEIYPSGEPLYREVQWSALVFDPRTVGHDIADKDTWDYRDNAALALADFLHHRDGAGIPRQFIENAMADLISAANDCDDAITLAAGGTEPRYRIWNTYAFNERPADVIARFLQAMDGRIVATPNQGLAIRPGKWRAPTVTIGPDDIVDYEVSRGREAGATANVIKAQFTSPLHDYQATDADEWRDTADVAARGEFVQSFEFYPAPSHGQCRRLMKLAARRLNPDFVISVTTNIGGLAAVGEQIITLVLPEAGINGTFEIQGDPEYLLGEEDRLLGLRFEAISLDASAYDWTTAEEGTAPPVPGAPLVDAAIPAVSGFAVAQESRAVNGALRAAFAILTWTAPTDISLSTQTRVKRTSEPAANWIDIPVLIDLARSEYGPLADATQYEFQARHLSPSGRPGPWTVSVLLTAVADPTPPGPVTGFSGSTDATTDEPLFTFTAPNSANFQRGHLYRSSGGVFPGGTPLAVIAGAPNQTVTYRDTVTGSGSWNFWLRAANGSGVESAEAGPVALTVHDLLGAGAGDVLGAGSGDRLGAG